MSSGATNEELLKQIEALERYAEGVSNALKAARKTRLIVLLLVVSFVGIFCWMFYNKADQFGSEENLTTMMELAKTRLEQNQGDYTKEVRRLVDFAQPILASAFQAQTKKDMPKYMRAIQNERDLVVKNLQVRFKKQLEERHEALTADFGEVLAKEFPEAQDEATQRRMMDNVQNAMSNMVERYYVDELRSQLEQMYKTWDDFPVAIHEKGDPLLEDQLFADLLELLALKLASSNPATP